MKQAVTAGSRFDTAPSVHFPVAALKESFSKEEFPISFHEQRALQSLLPLDLVVRFLRLVKGQMDINKQTEK